MKVNVRPANSDDIKQISELMQELLGNTINERESIFKDALSYNNYVALVAEIDENIVGFLDIWCFPDVGHGANLGLIGNFIVSKRYRKMGIGSKLMEESMKIAREKKFHEFHVWTDTKNKDAIEMYKKHGFTREWLLLEKEFD